jgi:hypothetical protein
MKRDIKARRHLLSWLEVQGMTGATHLDPESSHLLAACASVLAAWKWASGQPIWINPAILPFHPYDFAC